MLTGRQVFAGETVSHVLAAVLKDEPDWAALPPDTPASIRRLLRRCLEKDRKRRLRIGGRRRVSRSTMRSMRRRAVDLREGPEPRLAVGARCAFVIVAASVIGAAVWVARRNSRPRSPAEVVRFAIHDTDQVIVSRGSVTWRSLPMAASWRLSVLAKAGRESGSARSMRWKLAPSRHGGRPVVVLVAGRRVAGVFRAGPDQDLADCRWPAQAIADPRMNAMNGFAWGPDGTIVYAGLRGVWTVNASGGSPADVLPVAAGRNLRLAGVSAGRSPLSDGGAQCGSWQGRHVRGDRRRRRRAVASWTFPTAARYAMGRLIYVRDGVLYAQRF